MNKKTRGQSQTSGATLNSPTLELQGPLKKKKKKKQKESEKIFEEITVNKLLQQRK